MIPANAPVANAEPLCRALSDTYVYLLAALLRVSESLRLRHTACQHSASYSAIRHSAVSSVVRLYVYLALHIVTAIRSAAAVIRSFAIPK